MRCAGSCDISSRTLASTAWRQGDVDRCAAVAMDPVGVRPVEHRRLAEAGGPIDELQVASQPRRLAALVLVLRRGSKRSRTAKNTYSSIGQLRDDEWRG